MDPRDTVVVTGTGRAAAAPDALVLDLQLEGHGASVSAALAELTATTRACHEALPDQALRTHRLGLHPRHDHQGRQVGHTAYQALQLRTTDPVRAGELVHRLGEAAGDGLRVNGLSPEVSDTTRMQEQARERAFADARARAEHYARLAGRTLGPVRQVREVGGNGPQPVDLRAMHAESGGGPPTEMTDHEVVVGLEVIWELGQA